MAVWLCSAVLCVPWFFSSSVSGCSKGEAARALLTEDVALAYARTAKGPYTGQSTRGARHAGEAADQSGGAQHEGGGMEGGMREDAHKGTKRRAEQISGEGCARETEAIDPAPINGHSNSVPAETAMLSEWWWSGIWTMRYEVAKDNTATHSGDSGGVVVCRLSTDIVHPLLRPAVIGRRRRVNANANAEQGQCQCRQHNSTHTSGALLSPRQSTPGRLAKGNLQWTVPR